MLVSRRNYRATLLRLLAPCFFLLLALLLDYAIRNEQQSSEAFKEVKSASRNEVTGIPPCSDDIYIDRPCFDFIYSPNDNPTISVRARPRRMPLARR